MPVVAIDIHQKPCETVFYGANNFQAGQLDGIALGTVREDEVELQGRRAPLAQRADRRQGRRRPRERRDRRRQVAVPERQGDQGDDEGDDRLVDPAVHRHALAAARQAPPARRRDERRPVDRRDQGRAGRRAGSATSTSAAQGADPTSWPYICGKTPFKNWVDDTAYFPERYGDTVVPLLLSLIDGQKEPKFVFVNHRVVTPPTSGRSTRTPASSGAPADAAVSHSLERTRRPEVVRRRRGPPRSRPRRRRRLDPRPARRERRRQVHARQDPRRRLHARLRRDRDRRRAYSS